MNEEKQISRKKAVVLIVAIGVLAFAVGNYFSDDTYTDYYSTEEDNCNALAFSINGYLSTYLPSQIEGEEMDVASSEDIVYGIEESESDSEIKAVVLYIDSYGGSGVAGEEIANALKRFSKPSVAVIRDGGASAAYWAATGADRIYASRISDVGGIGVTLSYLDETNRNIKEGYTFVELSSARYKDAGDPNRLLTQAEKNIFLADLQKVHDVFVSDVSINRGLELEKVKSLANGLTYIGTDALDYGLIDEIGDLDTATKYLEEQIGEKIEFCWY